MAKIFYISPNEALKMPFPLAINMLIEHNSEHEQIEEKPKDAYNQVRSIPGVVINGG